MKLRIKVHPGSSKEEIRQISEKEYEIWLKERPAENKANIELIKMLQKYFKRDIKIKTGFSSKNKIVEVK